VTQHQNGEIDPTTGSDGPHGDWYMHGKPLSDTQWPTTTYTTLVQIYQNHEDPSDISIVQLKRDKKTNWVELPDCRGDSGEISLDADLGNASLASCKKADVEQIAAVPKSD